MQLLTFAWGSERQCSAAPRSVMCQNRETGVKTKTLLLEERDKSVHGVRGRK